MSYKPRYDRGDWKAICDSCGRLVKASELKQRWDGYMVDARCWEPRQPQDFVRGVADYQAPPYTRPEQSDSFIPLTLSNLIQIVCGSNASLTYRLFKIYTKLITTSIVTSLSSIATSVLPAAAVRSSSINGAPINKTTIG